MSKPVFTNTHKRNYIMLQDIAKQHALIPDDIPFDTKPIFHTDERVFCTDNFFALVLGNDINSFSRKNPENTFASKTYVINTTNRMLAEWCGTDLQIIVSALIHDEKEILLLKLSEKTIIDRYVPGTLTMVQGHTFAPPQFHGALRIDGLSFIEMLSENMGRELSEELTLNDVSEEDRVKELLEFKQLCQYLPVSIDTKIKSIQYDNEGTIRRHICFFFDIDARSNDRFYHFFQHHRIVSNEPDKHTVSYTTYRDLLELPNLDYICDWVKGALAQCDWFDKFCDPDVLTQYTLS